MRIASISALLLPCVLACGPVARQVDSNETLPFNYTQGADPPAAPETQGFFINHLSLLVSNLTATRDWYGDVLGMRHIFTFQLSPSYSIMYMGHSQGGRNGTGYQTGEEMTRDKNNMAGLIEFHEYKPASNRTFSPSTRTTFSHIGLIVPNITAAAARWESMGVEIIKPLGELDFSRETGNRALAAGFGFGDLDDEQVQQDITATLPGLAGIGFTAGVVVIADLDGNSIEVQQQVSEIV